MADKKTIQVIIDGKIYVLSGENSESYLHDVADYLNHKIESIRKEMWNYNKLEESVRSLLLQINICDELFQERKKVEYSGLSSLVSSLSPFSSLSPSLCSLSLSLTYPLTPCSSCKRCYFLAISPVFLPDILSARLLPL